MGRRKQSRPHRSGVLILDSAQVELKSHESFKDDSCTAGAENSPVIRPYFVEIDKSSWLSDKHRDISEIVLKNLSIMEGFDGLHVDDTFYQESRFFLRLRISNIDNATLNYVKLGHWPVLPPSDVRVELVENLDLEHNRKQCLILSGTFDGPADGITALVHLASIKYLTIRPIVGDELSENMISLRLRVELLQIAFDACGSLLDNTRKIWKKSIMKMMAWLRPEVLTSESRYDFGKFNDFETAAQYDCYDDERDGQQRVEFNVFRFYEAIKPERSSPLLEDDFADLIPILRPYQRRAVYWMVKKEKESTTHCARDSSQIMSPFCVPLNFLGSSSTYYYNPFSGSVSFQPEFVTTRVSGGILADEMGLGKTIELLACIFSHQWRGSEDKTSIKPTGAQSLTVKRLTRERVECICGAVSESSTYKGLWVQCDICNAWQHANCVGYSPRGEKKLSTREVQKKRRMNITIIERDGEFICQTCSDLLKLNESPMVTGATLIVCPLPILRQWHAEITRHTRPGSLKVCVYDGVRDAPFSDAKVTDIKELISADVVLTTYDVLKDDLSHDSDRHEGDRRFLRFQKRYPIIPTILTKIYWWRICLDEAQMVESNAAAATEMALRLSGKHKWCITGTPIQRKLNDLYGLLKFLRASPFDVYRWWNDVIRDPYERGDEGAIRYTHMFFRHMMWRSSKAHVAEELQLPPQIEQLSWLKFSAIEQHFYHRQHETCVTHAQEVIDCFKDDVLKRHGTGRASSKALSDHCITHTEASKLLNSLLKLRQACCHPQVGSSGLRSLQQTPMTMEEILMVLISKTKFEGEEALRKLVIALNALAGIAIIQDNFHQAIELYKEALATSEENAEDFRLDPLVNIHIHHNLAEILTLVEDSSILPSVSVAENFDDEIGANSVGKNNECDENVSVKRRKVERECLSFGLNNEPLSNGLTNKTSVFESTLQEDSARPVRYESDDKSHKSRITLNEDALCNEQDECHASKFLNYNLLRKTCHDMKQKYLSAFISRLLVARVDLKNNTEVCNEYRNQDERKVIWWLDALHHAEQNKDSSNELMKKIDEAVSGIQNSKTSRITTRFRSITALKYHVETRLNGLDASREKLLNRLLEVDQTMDDPRTEDIDRIKSCSNCLAIEHGPLCVHCEMEELFQDYEARLFRLNKLGGEIVTSAEEAIDLQKKNTQLNRFYWNLSQPNKMSSLVDDSNDVSRRRDVRDRIMVSKSPSELEVLLGVIKNCCKSRLGKDGASAASNQLHLLEAMRKEYASARSLAINQAQLLRAHDEIKMATSRLNVKQDESDKSAEFLSLDELDSANVLHSNDKFIAVASLSRINGKLRYLKRLVHSKQNSATERSCTSNLVLVPCPRINEHCKEDEDSCPVCHEKLGNQKMVFQCGHLTCCKCLFAMTERNGQTKFEHNWIMCPTCRQHSDFRNIAYADDKKYNDVANPASTEMEEVIVVQGSYGTKIEAVVRRILWIKSSSPKEKVLVFSSWNDVLDVLEHAFKANEISYVRMKGGRKSHLAISEFREVSWEEKQDVKVLLLLIQHGANGLNLLEAQHVILVEPLLNPAAEAQAISRVHRIGQQHRTTVHRFLVKNTVEESIHNLNRGRTAAQFVSGGAKNEDRPFLMLNDVHALFGALHDSPTWKDPPPSSLAADGSLPSDLT